MWFVDWQTGVCCVIACSCVAKRERIKLAHVVATVMWSRSESFVVY